MDAVITQRVLTNDYKINVATRNQYFLWLNCTTIDETYEMIILIILENFESKFAPILDWVINRFPLFS
jgi:hypothetical protein